MAWTPHSRKPKQAGEVITSTLKHLYLEKRAQAYSGFPKWKEIVGEEIAAVATPIKLVKKKVLVVRVQGIVWAQELSLRKSELIEKLLAGEFCSVLEDIKFVAGNPKDKE